MAKSLADILSSYGIPHINALNECGETPLYASICTWDEDDVRCGYAELLLTYGAQPNVFCVTFLGEFRTPFHAACATGPLRLVKSLVAARADLTLPEKAPFRHRPLEIASVNGLDNIVEWLIARGAPEKVYFGDPHNERSPFRALRDRWTVRWFLVCVMRRRYRFPLAIVKDVMQWI